MAFSYKKLWIILAEREMSKRELMRETKLSPATFTKLRRGQSVRLDVIEKICSYLKVDIGDIVSYIPEEE